jgi:hypothetical protein
MKLCFHLDKVEVEVNGPQYVVLRQYASDVRPIYGDDCKKATEQETLENLNVMLGY